MNSHNNPTTHPSFPPSDPPTKPPSPPPSFFTFPKGDLSSRLEIPFSFKEHATNPTTTTTTHADSTSSSTNQVHSFIRIQNAPTLYLDISDELNRDKLVCDALETENQSLTSTVSKYDTQLSSLLKENDSLKSVLVDLKNDYLRQNRILSDLTDQMKHNELNYIKHFQMQKHQIDKVDQAIKSILSEFNSFEHNNKQHKPTYSYDEYLNKKFSTEQYDTSFIVRNLTKDLSDFDKMNKIIYDNKSEHIKHLIKQIKDVLHVECDVNVYGSYATELCLHWSTVDIMITPNDDIDLGSTFTNAKYNTFVQTVFIKLQSLHNVKNITLIEENVHVPKIKLDTTDNTVNNSNNCTYNNNNNDITCYICVVNNTLLQHNNIFNRSTDIVKSYITKYEGVLKPLVLAIKHLLYNSLLISNYHNDYNVNGGISSYAIVIWVIYFLNNLSKAHEGGLTTLSNGDIFIEFLRTYGLGFGEGANDKIFYLNDTELNNAVLSYYNNIINEGGCEIVVIDPCDNKNNLCEKMFRFANIKIALMIAFFVGKDSCECSCHYKSLQSGNCETMNTSYMKDHCLLNKIFKIVKRFTSSNTF